MQLSERTAWVSSWVLTFVVSGLVTFLFRLSGLELANDFNVYLFPSFHALLNSGVALCLIGGLIAIKSGKITIHKTFMLSAFALSAVFLLSYVVYHALTDSTAYGNDGGIKYVYYFILITHILLAAFSFPFILMTFYHAWNNNFTKHRRLAKRVWPVWFYVAVTGVVVYFMIRPYYGV